MRLLATIFSIIGERIAAEFVFAVDAIVYPISQWTCRWLLRHARR